MNNLSTLRKNVLITKYFKIHFEETERWYQKYHDTDRPIPNWILEVADSGSLRDPDTGDDALTNVAVAAFLTGHAIRDSEVDCYHHTLMTTANYVAVKASLQNVGLDNLHRVLFTVEEKAEPSLVRISGGENSATAPIIKWSDFMNDPWDGEWSFASDTDYA